MSILVVTHNGQLPRNGGKRLGYQVGFMFFPITGGGPLDVTPRKPAQPPKPVIVIKYAMLPRTRHQDGECTKCGAYPNDVVRMKTDQGETLVVECHECHHLMRPY